MQLTAAFITAVSCALQQILPLTFSLCCHSGSDGPDRNVAPLAASATSGS